MKKIKQAVTLSWAFFALIFLCSSCSQEDDINGIFRSGTWYLSSLYVSNGLSSLTKDQQDDIVEIGKNGYYILFSDDTFSGKTLTKEFNGRWSVDGKTHALQLVFTSTGNPSDAVSKSMIEMLQKAASYKGDSNFLEIHEESSSRYVGLTRKKKE